ncbi:glycoside hydrolase family 35 protein [Salipaludibacillus agaradhaerens]|uniref:glycoside hydrolase family 35 protein n=1 Tax=Salipaludibacillus agaradhaerens TaxID=76935 RepID=UPI0030B8C478
MLLNRKDDTMLTTDKDQFLLNGEPFRILSGSIHYFRVVPGYWRDRLEKLKACGLNTVETYIPWNFHEPHKHDFRFDGMRDIEAFIKEADALGLYVILRPSPYICAEWEMGGLPAWLLKDRDMMLRCADPSYLQHVKEYYDVLLPKLATYQYSKGGPVIAFQIENEYGAYGNDKAYLNAIKRMYEAHGIQELLFTSDGPDMIKAGSLDNVLTTLNFGSKVKEAYQQLEDYKPGSPKLCAEFWIGWFDSWGNPHHTREADNTGDVFNDMLEAGGSVNFYMFHGGTNFHFYNGANHYQTYEPTITSYDYDALLTESGDITAKYRSVHDVLQHYHSQLEPLPTFKTERLGPQTIKMTRSVSIFDTLPSVSRRLQSKAPLSMEQADQAYGYMLYRTQVPGKGAYTIDLEPIRDRAYLYINGEFKKTFYRNDKIKEITLDFPNEVNIFEIFVENMGRVNYGKYLKDRKGLIDNIWINNQYMFDWEMYAIELEDFSLDFSDQTETRYPKFYTGEVTLDQPKDTFINLDGWKKGNVFVNGFNLGRYWEVGPQKTLYLPGPLLVKGVNTLCVLELEGTATDHILFTDQPNLG